MEKPIESIEKPVESNYELLYRLEILKLITLEEIKKEAPFREKNSVSSAFLKHVDAIREYVKNKSGVS